MISSSLEPRDLGGTLPRFLGQLCWGIDATFEVEGNPRGKSRQVLVPDLGYYWCRDFERH